MKIGTSVQIWPIVKYRRSKKMNHEILCCVRARATNNRKVRDTTTTWTSITDRQDRCHEYPWPPGAASSLHHPPPRRICAGIRAGPNIPVHWIPWWRRPPTVTVSMTMKENVTIEQKWLIDIRTQRTAYGLGQPVAVHNDIWVQITYFTTAALQDEMN